MSKYEAKVNVRFGQIAFFFDTLDELTSRLQDIDPKRVSELILDRIGAFVKKEPRKPKPGFEDVYRFTDDGLVELLVSPGGDIRAIALSVFAYDPMPASVQQISWSSGVDIAAVYKNVGHDNYRDYFTKVVDGYLLSPDGKRWLIEEVVPKVRKGQSKRTH